MMTLSGITPIEKAFYQMGKDDVKLQEYFFTYYSQKLVLLNHFYPHVEGKLRGFPDHGPGHVVRVMEMCAKLLKNNVFGLLDSQEVAASAALNFYEVYLLLCANVWHDVGNLLGRFKHNEKLVEISNRLHNNYFPDDDVKECVFQIARAHTGSNGVIKKIPLDDTDYRNEEINLRFLGAVLRFADELEEGGVRVDRPYYESMKDKIPEDKKIYWEACCCFNRIEPKPEQCVVEVSAKLDKARLFELFKKKGKDVALVDELIHRVDKMNRERIYYMGFVRKHVEYREILLNLTVKDSRPTRFTFEFNGDNGYHEFWGNFPQLDPEENLKRYVHQKR